MKIIYQKQYGRTYLMNLPKKHCISKYFFKILLRLKVDDNKIHDCFRWSRSPLHITTRCHQQLNRTWQKTEQSITQKVMLPWSCYSNPWCFSTLYEQSLWETSCRHPRWSKHGMFTMWHNNESEQVPFRFPLYFIIQRIWASTEFTALNFCKCFMEKDVARICNENLKSVKNSQLFLENISPWVGRSKWLRQGNKVWYGFFTSQVVAV